MKPARERFFPTPSSTPRKSSGPSFLANPDTPLHRSNSGSSGGRPHAQGSAILSALDQLHNTGVNRPPTQMGFTALMRKASGNALTSGPAGSIIRPGTAIPRASEERGLNVDSEKESIPVIAPTPKKHTQILPPFAFRNGSFGSEPLNASGDNHSSKSPDALIEAEGLEESFKVPFPKKSSVQQRESSYYQPKLLQRRGDPPPMLNDPGDQDGSNMSLQRNKKRMRDADEIEDTELSERTVKRFKIHEIEEDVERLQDHFERPSSTASSAAASYHDHPNVTVANMLPAQRSRVDHQENLVLTPTIPSNRTHVGLPRRPSVPIGLDKVLGPGSNDLLDQHASRYEALLNRWSECSVEEWKAGAEEISARFTMMLNFAKDHLDKKLKTYSSLNAVLDSHCEILRERHETMEATRQQLMKESRSVLG